MLIPGVKDWNCTLRSSSEVTNLDQVLQRPAQAIQVPDQEGVVGLEMLQRFFQLRSLPPGTREAISVNRITASFFQCLDLVFRLLVQRRDPSIPDALGQTFAEVRQNDYQTSLLKLLWNTILYTLRMLVNYVFPYWVGGLYK